MINRLNLSVNSQISCCERCVSYTLLDFLFRYLNLQAATGLALCELQYMWNRMLKHSRRNNLIHANGFHVNKSCNGWHLFWLAVCTKQALRNQSHVIPDREKRIRGKHFLELWLGSLYWLGKASVSLIGWVYQLCYHLSSIFLLLSFLLCCVMVLNTVCGCACVCVCVRESFRTVCVCVPREEQEIPNLL